MSHIELPQRHTHMKLAIGTGSDPGITRKHKPNEDSLFAIQGTQTCRADLQPLGLFVVADGMGGHAYGQEASNLALRVISRIVPPLLGDTVLDHDTLLELNCYPNPS